MAPPTGMTFDWSLLERTVPPKRLGAEAGFSRTTWTGRPKAARRVGIQCAWCIGDRPKREVGLKARPDGDARPTTPRRSGQGGPGWFDQWQRAIWSVSARQRTSEPEVAGEYGLKGNSTEVLRRLGRAPQTTGRPPTTRTNALWMRRKTAEPEGGWKARSRKRLTVAPRRNGMAASAALSIGEVANRCASAQR